MGKYTVTEEQLIAMFRGAGVLDLMKEQVCLFASSVLGLLMQEPSYFELRYITEEGRYNWFLTIDDRSLKLECFKDGKDGDLICRFVRYRNSNKTERDCTGFGAFEVEAVRQTLPALASSLLLKFPGDLMPMFKLLERLGS